MNEQPRPWYADTIDDYGIFVMLFIFVIIMALIDGRCSLRVVNTPTTQPAQEASPR